MVVAEKTAGEKFQTGKLPQTQVLGARLVNAAIFLCKVYVRQCSVSGGRADNANVFTLGLRALTGHEARKYQDRHEESQGGMHAEVRSLRKQSWSLCCEEV